MTLAEHENPIEETQTNELTTNNVPSPNLSASNLAAVSRALRAEAFDPPTATGDTTGFSMDTVTPQTRSASTSTPAARTASTPVATPSRELGSTPVADETNKTERPSLPNLDKGTEAQKKRAKKGVPVWAKVVASLVAVGTLGGGAVAVMGGGSSEKVSAQNPPEVTTSVAPETTVAPTTTPEATPQTPGFVDLASKPRSGAETVNLAINGRNLSIPKLSDPSDDPDQANRYNNFGTDASRFLSAYWTTGDRKFAQSFVSSESVIAPLDNTPEGFASYLQAEDGEFSQIAMFSGKENPAEFTGGTDQYGEFVTLSAGDFYVHPGAFEDPTFNGPETKNEDSLILYPLEELTFWFEKTEAKGIDYDGDVVIKRITVSYKNS